MSTWLKNTKYCCENAKIMNILEKTRFWCNTYIATQSNFFYFLILFFAKKKLILNHWSNLKWISIVQPTFIIKKKMILNHWSNLKRISIDQSTFVIKKKLILNHWSNLKRMSFGHPFFIQGRVFYRLFYDTDFMTKNTIYSSDKKNDS